MVIESGKKTIINQAISDSDKNCKDCYKWRLLKEKYRTNSSVESRVRLCESVLRYSRKGKTRGHEEAWDTAWEWRSSLDPEERLEFGKMKDLVLLKVKSRTWEMEARTRLLSNYYVSGTTPAAVIAITAHSIEERISTMWGKGPDHHRAQVREKWMREGVRGTQVKQILNTRLGNTPDFSHVFVTALFCDGLVIYARLWAPWGQGLFHTSLQ